jgi:hypothetical protein
MCLAPKMPPPPEPPPPPPPAPVPVFTSSDSPQAIKPTLSKRAALRKAKSGSSTLSIPTLSTGSMSGSPTNLSIGK